MESLSWCFIQINRGKLNLGKWGGVVNDGYFEFERTKISSSKAPWMVRHFHWHSTPFFPSTSNTALSDSVILKLHKICVFFKFVLLSKQLFLVYPSFLQCKRLLLKIKRILFLLPIFSWKREIKKHSKMKCVM